MKLEAKDIAYYNLKNVKQNKKYYGSFPPLGWIVNINNNMQEI